MTIFKFECVGDGESEYVCICMSSLPLYHQQQTTPALNELGFSVEW